MYERRTYLTDQCLRMEIRHDELHQRHHGELRPSERSITTLEQENNEIHWRVATTNTDINVDVLQSAIPTKPGCSNDQLEKAVSRINNGETTSYCMNLAQPPEIARN